MAEEARSERKVEQVEEWTKYWRRARGWWREGVSERRGVPQCAIARIRMGLLVEVGRSGRSKIVNKKVQIQSSLPSAGRQGLVNRSVVAGRARRVKMRQRVKTEEEG